jgi:hypothetical protein
MNCGFLEIQGVAPTFGDAPRNPKDPELQQLRKENEWLRRENQELRERLVNAEAKLSSS